jgi:carbamate kinase
MVRDGLGLRRAVPSPRPLAICELPVIRRLLDAGTIVICAGGGGIPVVVERGGRHRGVDAVVDKDLAAALLAEGVGAEGLVLLTDVAGIYDGWGTDAPTLMPRVRPAALRALALDAGSMRPKAEAAAGFVERTGGWAAIGALDEAAAVVAGRAGTLVGRREDVAAAASDPAHALTGSRA